MTVKKIDWTRKGACIGKYRLIADPEVGWARVFVLNQKTGEVSVVDTLRVVHDALEKAGE